MPGRVQSSEKNIELVRIRTVLFLYFFVRPASLISLHLLCLYFVPVFFASLYRNFYFCTLVERQVMTDNLCISLLSLLNIGVLTT